MLIRKFTCLCILLSVIFYQHSIGQKLPAGPQVLTFFSNADDTEQPYGLYIPQHYDPQKKYPLVIMLHGAGSNHRLALRRVFGKSNAPGENDVEASRYFPNGRTLTSLLLHRTHAVRLDIRAFQKKMFTMYWRMLKTD